MSAAIAALLALALLVATAGATEVRVQDPDGNDPVPADHDPLAAGLGRSTGYLPGIDVASWQHPGGASINWSQVAGAGYRYVYVKATEGTTYTNPWYSSDVAGASSVGMATGAYHYARPSRPISGAAAEALHFANRIGPQTGASTIPPVLDLEEHGGLTRAELADWTRIFLDETERLTNRRPVLYTGAYFWNDRVGSTAFGSTPLWLANYTSGPAPTVMPMGWPSWTFWQWTSAGSVPGIVGNVDLNRFNGSFTYLLSLGRGAAQGHAPTGYLDAVTSPRPGVLSARGWTVDRDIPWEPVRVDLYSNGKGLRGGVIADKPRNDIAQFWPAAGPYHGFDEEIPVQPGNHNVCAYAIDLPGTGGGNALLGCTSVWVVDPDSIFNDVLTAEPLYASLAWAHDSGVVQGWPDGTFRGTQPVTRGAASAFLHRLMGAPEDTGFTGAFRDIDADNPFDGSIRWMTEIGLTTGYEDQTFRATVPVSRQAAVAFLWRLAGSPEVEGRAFTDVGELHPFAAPIAWAEQVGITEGYPDGGFRPTEPVSRFAMAAFLHRSAQL